MKKDKTTVLFIIGPSGSGKDYMANYLKRVANIPSIVSYTTRDKRPTETDGVEHYFVNDEDYQKAKKSNDIFAETIFGGKHYWSCLSQFEEYNICTYIIDERGLLYIEENPRLNINKLFNYKTIYIKRGQNNINVSKNRIIRDKERIILPDSYYNYIIDNNSSSLKYFERQIEYTLRDVLAPIVLENVHKN